MAAVSSLEGPVVVVGMHRSGTSLTASILGSSGLHLGERLMPANPGNAEGYFEDLDFVDLHSAALRAQGLHPDGWDEVVLGDMPAVFEAKAQALTDARSSRPLWGWKDPRTTLFLPFWERLLPEARFVFVYRKPWEVIDSLYCRGDDKFRQDPAAAARLWSHYNGVILDALSRIRGRGVLFDLEDIVACPGAFVDHVNHAFGIQLSPSREVFKPILLGRGDRLADWRALTESVLPTEVALLRRLDEAAHQLAVRSPPAVRAEAPTAPRGALLRQWASLRATEQAPDELAASGAPRPGESVGTAECRDRAAQRSLEVERLREALARAESRLGEVSRAVKALQQSRTYRLGRLLLAPWRRARSVAGVLRRRLAP